MVFGAVGAPTEEQKQLIERDRIMREEILIPVVGSLLDFHFFIIISNIVCFIFPSTSAFSSIFHFLGLNICLPGEARREDEEGEDEDGEDEHGEDEEQHWKNLFA